VNTAAPPSPRMLVSVWLCAAVGFGALLGGARATQGSLDDTDPALQRPGFLDVGALPLPAPPAAGTPSPGRRAVVFFERAARVRELCRALARRLLTPAADVAIVAADPDTSCPVARVLVDPEGDVARRYGMRRPRGGRPPVGYAVVDSNGAIRYRTLDPRPERHLDEVATILRAAP
jgi:hypothetical protein